ncbi:hypothetical protein ABTK28_20785, partial [Acinetobacter baumannii]
ASGEVAGEEDTAGVREGSRESADCVMGVFHVSARNRPSDVGTDVPPMILCAKLHLHKRKSPGMFDPLQAPSPIRICGRPQ